MGQSVEGVLYRSVNVRTLITFPRICRFTAWLSRESNHNSIPPRSRLSAKTNKESWEVYRITFHLIDWQIINLINQTLERAVPTLHTLAISCTLHNEAYRAMLHLSVLNDLISKFLLKILLNTGVHQNKIMVPICDIKCRLNMIRKKCLQKNKILVHRVITK